jgi:hypothetical protein
LAIELPSIRGALRRAAQSTLVELREIFPYDARTLSIVLLTALHTRSCGSRPKRVARRGAPAAGGNEPPRAAGAQTDDGEPTEKMSRDD